MLAYSLCEPTMFKWLCKLPWVRKHFEMLDNSRRARAIAEEERQQFAERLNRVQVQIRTRYVTE